jgi:hypothetical protein
MSKRYVGDVKQEDAKRYAARTLGVHVFQLCMIYSDEKGYIDVDARISAERAMLAYKRMSDETESVLLDYEIELSRVKSRKAKLQISEGRCGICHQEVSAGYSACAVCLDVYHQQVREGFLKSLDSCEALRIIDGKD